MTTNLCQAPPYCANPRIEGKGVCTFHQEERNKLKAIARALKEQVNDHHIPVKKRIIRQIWYKQDQYN